MTKMTMIYALNKEIKKINHLIDHKIVRGVSYEREAKKHKHLVGQLRKVESQASLARTFSLASFFL